MELYAAFVVVACTQRAGYFIVLAFIPLARPSVRPRESAVASNGYKRIVRTDARCTSASIENIGLFLTPPFIPGDMNFYDDLTAARFSYERIPSSGPLCEIICAVKFMLPARERCTMRDFVSFCAQPKFRLGKRRREKKGYRKSEPRAFPANLGDVTAYDWWSEVEF